MDTFLGGTEECSNYYLLYVNKDTIADININRYLSCLECSIFLVTDRELTTIADTRQNIFGLKLKTRYKKTPIITIDVF